MSTFVKDERLKKMIETYLKVGREKTCTFYHISRKTFTDYLTLAKKRGLITVEDIKAVDAIVKPDNKIGLGKVLDQPTLRQNNKLFTPLNTISNMGVTLEDFRSKNDPQLIIKNGLSKLTKDRLYKTSEFKQLIGLPNNYSYSLLEDNNDLEIYHGKCSSGVYWSHPEVIEQLKNEMVLR